jgi:hypothetical protein
VLSEILHLLSNNRWFALLSVAYLLSTIGSGLTQVVVYGELAQRHASPLGFSLAYVFSILPAVFALHIGKRLLERMRPISILVISEAVGALGVVIPFAALRFDSVDLLVASSLLPSISVGIGVPAYSLLLKRGFVDKDFATVSAIESISLSSHIILGVGVGTLLFPFLARDVYLGVDLLTYVVSIGLLIASKGSAPVIVNEIDKHVPASDAKGTQNSVRPVVYWPIPVVAALTSPAMALLPAAGYQFSPVTWIDMSLNASLALLLARGASQLLGPALIKHRTVDELYKNKWAMAAYFAGFSTLYLVALASSSLLVACLCVLTAHILAYALSATVQTALFKKFPERDLVAVSSRTYQVQIISASLPGLLAGLMAESTGILGSYVGLTVIVVVVCFGFNITHSRRGCEEK